MEKGGRGEKNLWRILCLLQLTILQQLFPLALLIITVIEIKRRYKESPTVTPPIRED